MIVKDIIDKIEKFCPLSIAFDWDNSGFLLGDINAQVKKIMITLDVDVNTVDKAVKEKVDMIVSHHPMFFRGIKNIDYSSPDGYIVKELIKNNIAVYAAHTNMDCAPNGINQALAEKLNLSGIEELYGWNGLGRVGYIEGKYTLSDFANCVREKLDADGLRYCGDKNKIVSKVCVAGGSCSEVIPSAIQMGCDVIVTGDIKYHEAIDFTQSGICIIDVGHYSTEVFVKQIFLEILNDSNLEFVLSDSKDIFNFA